MRIATARPFLSWILACGLPTLTLACTTLHETTGALGTSLTATPGQESSPAASATPSGASVGSRKGVLDRETAFKRARQVQRVRYQLQFKLDADAPEFVGKERILFDLRPRAADQGSELQLDFGGGKVLGFEVNGKALQASDLKIDSERILVPLDVLRPEGPNELTIEFSHPYSNDGAGLHRFKDPEDDRTYLYTQMEPFDANRVFPCFDQPDIKATYELAVETPEAWQVIANTHESEVQRIEGRKRWLFPVSKPFSTYLFALHAGPYATWRSKAGDVPLRLFARRSLSQDVDSDEWFEITRKGLDYYGIQFGIDYPYQKYDQIIVPEFNAGAMENVAAVTFSERMVFRTRVTQDRRRSRAETILHEMAHMWFGDLVTMHWWNGLWLNESFATFMAALATEKTTRFKGSWESFFAGDKTWGYWEDQLVTTHPIEQPVRDTVEAETSFDGVTYGKGAAVLKQLYAYVGEDDFREGIQRYIEAFANKNSTLGDFIQKLAEASGKNLLKWQRAWLQTTGMNTVRAQFTCAPDEDSGTSVIKELLILQSAEQGTNLLRPHKTEVALYRSAKGSDRRSAPLEKYAHFPVTYAGAKTHVTEAEGEPCPEFVFPNDGDLDYFKLDLDPDALRLVLKRLRFINDLLTRHLLWHALWERVVDGKLAPQVYIDAVLTHLPHEQDTQLLSAVLKTLASHFSIQRTAWGYLSEDARPKYLEKIEALLKTRLMGSSGGSDHQLVWWEAFRAAASPKQNAWFKRLLDGKAALAGLPMDQEHRWEVIQVLARGGHKQIAKIIADELARDPSDRGRKKADGAEASIAEPATRAQWIARILREPGTEALPVSRLREAMSRMHVIEDAEGVRKFAEKYFAAFDRLNKARELQDAEYATGLAEDAFPAACDETIVSQARGLLKEHTDLPATVTKQLHIAIQEEERCIRARALSAKAWAERPLPHPKSAVPQPTPEAGALPDSGPSPSPSAGAAPSPTAP